MIATGRRSGKTTLGTYRTSRIAIDYAGSICWWIAPKFATADIAWRRFRLYLTPVVSYVSEVRKMMVLVNGSEIWCKTAENPDNLRGEGVDDLTLDEAAFIRNLDYVWLGILRPMLIDTGGSMFAVSTPNRRNTFYTWFNNGQDPLQEDWASWNFSTMANPHLPPRELESLLEDYPPESELYRQEILGEFLEGRGQVFTRVDRAQVNYAPPPFAIGRRYVAGIDWGRNQDFTVCIIFDQLANAVVDILRINAMDYNIQRDYIRRLFDKWGVEAALVELNSIGQPNYEELRRDGLPVIGFTTTGQSKAPLIEGLAQAFQLELIKIPQHPVLVSELMAYERRIVAETGAAHYGAPEGMHDDTVMALALAWRMAQGAGLRFGIAEA